MKKEVYCSFVQGRTCTSHIKLRLHRYDSREEAKSCVTRAQRNGSASHAICDE